MPKGVLLVKKDKLYQFFGTSHPHCLSDYGFPVFSREYLRRILSEEILHRSGAWVDPNSGFLCYLVQEILQGCHSFDGSGRGWAGWRGDHHGDVAPKAVPPAVGSAAVGALVLRRLVHRIVMPIALPFSSEFSQTLYAQVSCHLGRLRSCSRC